MRNVALKIRNRELATHLSIFSWRLSQHKIYKQAQITGLKYSLVSLLMLFLFLHWRVAERTIIRFNFLSWRGNWQANAAEERKIGELLLQGERVKTQLKTEVLEACHNAQMSTGEKMSLMNTLNRIVSAHLKDPSAF